MRYLKKAHICACAALFAVADTACSDTQGISAQSTAASPANSAPISQNGTQRNSTVPGDIATYGDAGNNTPTPEAASAPQAAPSPVASEQDAAMQPSGGQPDANLCGNMTENKAVDRWIGQVPQIESGGWQMANPGAQTYDPCKPLSWISLTASGGTASSAMQIMLFHNGTYIGTATSKAYPYAGVSRINERRIEVQYRHPRSGDSNANPTGVTHACFSWSDESNSVAMEGLVPPN